MAMKWVAQIPAPLQMPVSARRQSRRGPSLDATWL
jgi:hypothetical protein